MSVREILGDPSWLFQLGFPIQRFDVTTSKTGLLDDLSWSLSSRYTIPAFGKLCDTQRKIVEYRCAWHERGIMLEVEHESPKELGADGKPRPKTTPPTNDGHTLTCYLDTRGSSGIHRANQFCHRLVFEYRGSMALKNRVTGDGDCRSIPRAIASVPYVKRECLPFQIEVSANKRVVWRLFLNGSGLHGFDPIEYPDVGIFLSIHSPELGTINVARSLLAPVHEDPSLWCRGKFV